MIRLVLFFVLLALVAYGGVYLVEHPGHITLDWFGWQIETSAALLVLAIAVAAVIAWIVFRFVVGLPSFVAYSARRRRREKGYEALSRGLVAVHSGDARSAGRASAQASRQLANDPLALMLRAQSAQLNGDARGAVQAYEQMAQRADTRVLGLRGLHAEAVRRGDDEASRHFAEAAHKTKALPWTAQARLEHHAGAGDWEQALRTVEAAVAAKHIDKETGERERAVLETAIGYDKELTAPDEALTLARAAIKRAPDLAPPVVLAARVLSRRGEIRKAAKLIERAWPRCPHPDIAQAYMDVRLGDSTTDRLNRARTLMGLAAYDPVGRLTVARAALANTDYAATRTAMEPLVAEGKRPTVKMCLLMAELEEAEHGDNGLWREWLARASRAALDPVWMADGIVYDEWGPASPTTGRLDAFRWQVPAERPGPAMDALPPRREASLPRSTPQRLTVAETDSEPSPPPSVVSDRSDALLEAAVPDPSPIPAPAPVEAYTAPHEQRRDLTPSLYDPVERVDTVDTKASLEDGVDTPTATERHVEPAFLVPGPEHAGGAPEPTVAPASPSNAEPPSPDRPRINSIYRSG